MAILVVAAGIPLPASAQDGVVVEGRVFQFGSRTVIRNATVELEGYGAMLTTTAGTFRFEDVEPGDYTLRVDAFGYDPESLDLEVDSATSVLVPLRAAPLPLDSLVVEAGTIDIEGRVRDPELDLLLVGAEVFTDQIPGTLTDANGRFKLDNVLEGIPLRLVVRAFGYLRADTVVVPDEDERYVFELRPDPWIEDMIAGQVAILEDRTAGLRTVPPMDRERLLRYAGTFTLLDALEAEYSRHRVNQITCLLIDEKRDEFRPVKAALTTTLPEELERIELLYEGRMLRLYTREFMQDMFDLAVEIGPPYMVINTPICR